MKAHFVRFYSPGSFCSECTEKPIEDWNVQTACEMAHDVVERYGAKPYAFQFFTKTRKDDELDSRVTQTSNMYFLGGKIETYDEIVARNLPEEEILRWNMKNNGYDRVIVNTNSYRHTSFLENSDVVLQWTP